MIRTTRKPKYLEKNYQTMIRTNGKPKYLEINDDQNAKNPHIWLQTLGPDE